MKAMVLAAGKGERMRPLTLNTPKPLLQAGGKTLINYHLENLSANGITDIVINHAWLGEKIELLLGNGKALGVNIVWSREGEPLETAGGIMHALPLLQKNADSASFVCVNSDIWTDYPFKKLPEVDGEEMLAWLVLVDNPDHHPEGDFMLQDGKVQEPADNQRQEPAYTFSGIAVYHPALFDRLEPGKQSIVPLLKQAMVKGKVGGEHYKGQWFDIGTPERLDALEEFLMDR
ncbi:MAG: nucleotidyltransferase family protein [Gammaproteobacteria bacterium]|nr:nucleotidyltransferase family protein [Gammaproteobacteria bacterium]